MDRGEISQTRFGNCQLTDARFEDATLDHVIFTGCKLDYATLSWIRNSGCTVSGGGMVATGI